jgi:hypothetical protein
VDDIGDIDSNYRLYVQVLHLFETPFFQRVNGPMLHFNNVLLALKYFIRVNECDVLPFKDIKKCLIINQTESTSSPLFFTAFASFF